MACLKADGYETLEPYPLMRAPVPLTCAGDPNPFHFLVAMGWIASSGPIVSISGKPPDHTQCKLRGHSRCALALQGLDTPSLD